MGLGKCLGYDSMRFSSWRILTKEMYRTYVYIYLLLQYGVLTTKGLEKDFEFFHNAGTSNFGSSHTMNKNRCAGLFASLKNCRRWEQYSNSYGFRMRWICCRRRPVALQIRKMPWIFGWYGMGIRGWSSELCLPPPF